MGKTARIVSATICGIGLLVLYQMKPWILLSNPSLITNPINVIIPIIDGAFTGFAGVMAARSGKTKEKKVKGTPSQPQIPLETLQKLGIVPPGFIPQVEAPYTPAPVLEPEQSKILKYIVCYKCRRKWREDELSILEIPENDSIYIQYICPNKSCLNLLGSPMKLNVAFKPNPNIVSKLEKAMKEAGAITPPGTKDSGAAKK
ncbi:MAG: hypothetical protein E6L03_09950 [Thaumarchaeota archaeon]|nr:MAG: hypothetical protein E6L03_09950 [Nitrososphaerota archaeon]